MTVISCFSTRAVRRPCGIVGGMGPEATVELMRRVIAATPARDDADHIRMLVDNNPMVPSRIRAIIDQTGESPAPMLAAMAQSLAMAGADFLAIPCNTAHYYLPHVSAAVTVPVLDMIGLTADLLSLRMPPVRVAGVLASSAVRLVSLFDKSLGAGGILVFYPAEADEVAVLELIRAVRSGQGPSPAQMQAYHRVAESLAANGADTLVIACTELSLIDRPPTALPVIDTLDVGVSAILAHSKEGLTNRAAA